MPRKPKAAKTAEKETAEAPKEKVMAPTAPTIVVPDMTVPEIIPPVPIPDAIEAPLGIQKEKGFDKEAWQPKTEIGKKVKSGEISNIDQILEANTAILEAAITDVLLPTMESDLLGIGQSKGKFGGGKRSIWRQVQKKTAEGNKPGFAALVVIGNRNGYLGLGYGKARETLPGREKAIRKAKTNIIKVYRGCGSWECNCGGTHSIPCKVRAKCGSAIVELIPAPKGTGLAIEKEAGKLLALAGIKDIYSRTFGQTRTKLNHIKAVFEALKSLAQQKGIQTKTKPEAATIAVPTP